MTECCAQNIHGWAKNNARDRDRTAWHCPLARRCLKETPRFFTSVPSEESICLIGVKVRW